MWQQEQYERRQRDSCEHSQHRPEKVGPPDAYSFSPTSVQLSKGSALGIENKTDEDHSIACKPDAGVGTTKIAENETKSSCSPRRVPSRAAAQSIRKQHCR